MATKKRNARRVHGVRPPRTPKGEDPQVTIANHSRQIELMIARVQTLTAKVDAVSRDNQLLERERDDQITMTNQIIESHKAEREIFDRTCVDLNNKVLAYTRLQGWQDCAREILSAIIVPDHLRDDMPPQSFEPFPFDADGGG